MLPIARQDHRLDLHFIVEARGKERANGPVHEPRGERLFDRRPAFAFDKAAREFAGGSGALSGRIRSRLPDPRVDVAVRDVGAEVGDDHGGGEEQEHTLDHGVVQALDRAVGQQAESRPREHRLDHHGAAPYENLFTDIELETTRIYDLEDARAFLAESGLDVDALLVHRDATGSVVDFPGADSITNEELLLLDVDVLVPAALENVITTKNAAKIRAKIICEGANGPTTAGADAILEEKGVFVIPDILANAGGVTVSYFEWSQNLTQFYWDEERVNVELERKMRKAFMDVHTLARQEKCSMRTSAFMLALRRVGEAEQQRGN